MATEDQITLTLEGDRAREGVTLAAFDGFVRHFLSALRYHYRSSQAAVIRKSGRPFADEDLATSFRLVAFRQGSGIAVLEPALASDEEAALTDDLPPTLAWDNVGALLDGIEHEAPLDPSVTEELEAALRSLGRDARLSVEVASNGSRRVQTLDEERVVAIRAKWERTTETESEQTVVGALHAIDLEPDKVAIRTASGMDWSCEYPPSLERDVLALVGRRVWAHGIGRITSGKAGALRLHLIRPLMEPEQTQLFTGPPISLESLKEQQRIAGPQGLSTFADPEWRDSEESELFLRALLNEEE